MKKISLINLILSATILAITSSCSRPENTAWQGYLEGEYVYIAAPLSGQLITLDVARGDRVTQGTPLFSLENTAESASRNEATQRLHAAEARLADLRKGSRPSELAALTAQLAQARTIAELSQTELARQTKLHETNVSSTEAFDRARLTHEKNLGMVNELIARLATAKLGGRADTIHATEADTSAAHAAVERAAWNVSQKAQAAPQAGLIHDTLYRTGEYVPAGKPVIALLPPENIKVRFFVSETILGSLEVGDAVQVTVDGRDSPLTAHISYRSTQAEYTPPVLYNRENRAKLTYMIEAAFSPVDARDLHPGQPVDVIPAP